MSRKLRRFLFSASSPCPFPRHLCVRLPTSALHAGLSQHAKPTHAQALAKFDPLVFKQLPSEDRADQVKANLRRLVSLVQRALAEMHDESLHLVHRNGTIVEAGAALHELQSLVLGDTGEAEGNARGVHPKIRKRLSNVQVEAAEALMEEVAALGVDGPAVGGHFIAR